MIIKILAKLWTFTRFFKSQLRASVAGDRVNPLHKCKEMSAYCVVHVVVPAGAFQHWLLHRMLSTFLVPIEYILSTYLIHIAYMLLCFQQAMPTDVERGLFHIVC